MSKIRSRWTKLDMAMLKMLKRSDMEFETYPRLFGNPDFLVYPNVVVFCDSSFWHGRDWRRLKKQLARGGNPSYWQAHIEKNRRHDKTVTKELKKQGFKVVRLWDVDIYKKPELCLSKIKQSLE